MHVLGDASTKLARQPAMLDCNDLHAGMTFTMLRGVEPLLTGVMERKLLVERAAELMKAERYVGAS